MEPFPFTIKEDNQKHRENMINRAGSCIFIFGDYEGGLEEIQKSGMWKEYMQAKKDTENIIIPLPCGSESISEQIFKIEKAEQGTFSARYSNLLESFNYKSDSMDFFDKLVEKVVLTTREKLDIVIEDIIGSLTNKH